MKSFKLHDSSFNNIEGSCEKLKSLVRSDAKERDTQLACHIVCQVLTDLASEIYDSSYGKDEMWRHLLSIANNFHFIIDNKE
jgi:hypothetical protein